MAKSTSSEAGGGELGTASSGGGAGTAADGGGAATTCCTIGGAKRSRALGGRTFLDAYLESLALELELAEVVLANDIQDAIDLVKFHSFV